jgi:hypothetical protein
MEWEGDVVVITSAVMERLPCAIVATMHGLRQKMFYTFPDMDAARKYVRDFAEKGVASVVYVPEPLGEE